MSTLSISDLDNDSLLMIFDSITCQIPISDTQINRPLTVVRAASQVCQGWRRLLLASPWIWGRLIDLDVAEYVGPRRIKWMDEVVNRAGSAPLWISGIVDDPKKSSNRLFDTQAYFIRLLEAWERIEKLSVVIYGRKIPDVIQSHFLSPAPILKLFDVDLMQVEEPLFFNIIQPGSSKSLFADYAPFLRVIRAGKITFKPNSPWLSNIREIYPIPINFGLKYVFSVLQHTPFLQHISIVEDNGHWDQTWPLFSNSKANLPNLSSLDIWTTLAFASRILDNLSISTVTLKLSALRMNILDFTPALTDCHILSSIKENLPFYIFSYFTLNPSTNLQLVVTDRQFNLRDTTKRSDDDRQFAIDITTFLPDQRDGYSLAASLLDALILSSSIPSAISSPFKSVTAMRLKIDNNQPDMIKKIYSAISVFEHVQLLQTNESSNQTISTISCLDEAGRNQQRVLLPELQTLRFTVADPKDHKTYTDELMLFVVKRKEIGYPLSRLDLITLRDKSYYAQGIRALEGVDGLEVVWAQWPDDNYLYERTGLSN